MNRKGNQCMTKEQLRMIIGKNISAERKARRMTRDVLAEALNTTVPHIGLIERGERGATSLNLLKLSDLFGVSVATFFPSPEHKQNPSYEDISNRERCVQMILNMKNSEVDYLIQSITGLRNLIRMTDD